MAGFIGGGVANLSNDNADARAVDRSRLRLAAATGLLKLCTQPTYARLLTPAQAQTLLFTAQDSCVRVRTAFLAKLHAHLLALRLPLSFAVGLCLSATDPDTACAKAVRLSRAQLGVWVHNWVFGCNSFV